MAYLVLAVVLLKDAPRERLIERFARGEITEDFLERRAVFGGSTPGAAGDDSH